MGPVGVIQDALETGLPYAPASLGVWMTFRLQRDFDLTVNGSFVLGGGVFAVWVSHGGGALVATVLAVASGVGAGLVTMAVVHYLRLGLILSGIIVGLGLYSVALWVMGQPDIAVIGDSNALVGWTNLFAGGDTLVGSIEFFGVVAVCLSLLTYLCLKTEFGLVLRASGMNRPMVRSNGNSPTSLLLAAVVAGNAMTALSGTLVVQQQGFSDVQGGLNDILLGVTAVLIGEMILGARGVGRQIAGVLLGTVVYYVILSAAFNAGLNPDFLEAITAGAVLVLVSIRLMLDSVRTCTKSLRRRWRTRQSPGARFRALDADRTEIGEHGGGGRTDEHVS